MKRIASCTITAGKTPEVHVVFDDGTTAVLFSYFADSHHFTAEEFVGKTRREALSLVVDRFGA